MLQYRKPPPRSRLRWVKRRVPGATGSASNFRCGGVGEADQQRIKAEAAQHDLMLTFAVSNGAYLADVDVRIADARGNVVVQGRCGGPIMLVGLASVLKRSRVQPRSAKRCSASPARR